MSPLAATCCGLALAHRYQDKSERNHKKTQREGDRRERGHERDQEVIKGKVQWLVKIRLSIEAKELREDEQTGAYCNQPAPTMTNTPEADADIDHQNKTEKAREISGVQ